MSGVVIVGYQGIGKSSCAGQNGCVDLESGNFFVNGMRHDDWATAYCNIAQHIAEQGYTVFTSSHQVVRDELAMRSGLRVVVVAPSDRLHDPWIERLESRYRKTDSEKDRRALMNAVDRYEQNVRELAADTRFETVVIDDMGYDLMDIVRDIRHRGDIGRKMRVTDMDRGGR